MAKKEKPFICHAVDCTANRNHKCKTPLSIMDCDEKRHYFEVTISRKEYDGLKRLFRASKAGWPYVQVARDKLVKYYGTRFMT